jgi:uncharacterized protein YkwD
VNDTEALLWRRLNHFRHAHDVPRLTWGTDRMHRAGRRHCRGMADAHELYHQAFPLPAEWLYWGQNVGEGPHASDVQEAFQASPLHRANMLDPEFTRATVSALRIGGVLWVVQNYLTP